MEIVDVQTQESVVYQHSPGALVAAVVCPASGRSALADSSTVSPTSEKTSEGPTAWLLRRLCTFPRRFQKESPRSRNRQIRADLA